MKYRKTLRLKRKKSRKSKRISKSMRKISIQKHINKNTKRKLKSRRKTSKKKTRKTKGGGFIGRREKAMTRPELPDNLKKCNELNGTFDVNNFKCKLTKCTTSEQIQDKDIICGGYDVNYPDFDSDDDN